MTTPTTGNLPSIYETIDQCLDAAKWLIIIVGAYLVLEWVTTDDDPPEGFA